ncbi:glycosyltransferase [Seonamhaeicola sp.]|uniref:glycosyltransferase family 2 protein n=1 Tax=Seonamhaeicola sp. TaxID=1912245 RepID=UPI002604AEC0|nr:glycosyltransferase [Seonamhaeicola sp.]
MLSILIPTYNYDVTTLVNSLHKQALASNITFEILVFDDGSEKAINRNNYQLNELANVNFKSRSQNIGLSNNRNELANAAKYTFLLFIDGDSLVISENYIDNYLKELSKGNAIIYGGRIHPKKVPDSRKLRWKYGKFREDLTAEQRSLIPYKCTFCNNTLMTKGIYNKIGFEKTLTQYGHEDTLFAYNASLIKASVMHIDNPVLHGDVDLSDVFFNKTIKGLENLNYIYEAKLIDPKFTPFLYCISKLKAFKLNYFFAFLNLLVYPISKYISTSKYPSLFLFDIFRVCYFCHINLTNESKKNISVF